jgi:hypothetical protein
MKKVYAEVKNRFSVNSDVQLAIDGFNYLGYEAISFDKIDTKIGIRFKSPFVGSINTMTYVFKTLNKYPEPIDFPQELIDSNLIGRDVMRMNLTEAISLFIKMEKPMFIKPVQTKLFDGVLISKKDHLPYLRRFENLEVWVNEEIKIISEHRAYVHKGKLIYCCNYSGDFRVNPNYQYIDAIIQTYKSAPVSYTIDVAVLEDFKNVIIEVNDFWAIGGYGMKPWDYAQMLLDRYNEIIGNQDEG